MVQLGQRADQMQTSLAAVLGSLGILACIVVTVLGIKLKWFKHRLSFEPLPAENGSISGTFRDAASAQSTQYSQTVTIHGIFRQRFDEDEQIERPKSLPPIRIRTSKTPPSMLPPKRVASPIPDEESRLPPTQEVVASTDTVFLKVEKKWEVEDTINKSPKKGKSRRTKKKPASDSVEGLEEKPVTSDQVQVQDPEPKVSKKQGVRFDESVKSAKKKVEKSEDVVQRRPTGFIRPIMVEESDEEEEIKADEISPVVVAETEVKPVPKQRSITKTEVQSYSTFVPIKDSSDTAPPPPPQPTVEQDDSWSAIQRHRNLTRELTKEVREVSLRKAAESNGEFRNPLAGGNDEHKPRTMRDMKKSQNKQNELILEQDSRQDAEA